MFSKYWLNYSMIANDENSTFLSEFLRERRSFRYLRARVKRDDEYKIKIPTNSIDFAER